jgi:hypothetical protein
MPNALAHWLLATILAAAALPLAPQERRPVDAPPAPAPPMTAGDERTVIHDVADIVDRKATRGADGETTPEDRRAALAELVEGMRSNIRPDTLRDKIVGLGDGLIVVLGTEAQQELVRRFLTDLRSYMGVLFDLQFGLLTLSAETAEALGLDKQATIFSFEARLGQQATILSSGTQTLEESLAEWAKKGTAAEILTAPRVLAFNNQKAVVSTVERVPYISGYARYEAVEPTGRPLVDPLIEFFEEGTSIECTARLTQQDHVSVELSAEFKQVVRPIERREGPLGVSCAPLVSSRRFTSNVIVPDGGTVAFPALTVEGQTTVLLMRVTRVEPEPK